MTGQSKFTYLFHSYFTCLTLVFLGLMISPSLIYSQSPKLTTTRDNGGLEIRDCNSRSAGTIAFGPVVGQSNNSSADTIFLCYGDEIYIQNNKDGDFMTGDPDAMTPAAAGYLLYSCRPTVNGNDFTAIDGDCNLANPAPPAGSFWYQMGTPDGDILLVNDGSINNLFSAGLPFPVWMAPATFDFFNLVNGEYEGGYENGGSCIKVSTNAAFPVVYLNEIQVLNFTTNSPTSLAGNFVVSGGYPQFDPAGYFNISMSLVSNPNVKANLSNGPYKEGTKVQFAAPQAGTYNITITDRFNCAHTETVTLPYDEVNITVASGTVAKEDSICLDVTVANFNAISSGQFSINFDPSKLQFQKIDLGANPLNLSATGNFGTTQLNLGEIRFFWADPTGNSVTLTDNTVLFSICFKAIGDPGTKTPVRITAKPISIEFTNINGTQLNPKITNGTVDITAPNNLFVDIKTCSTTGNTGSITVTVYGPESQYNISFNSGLPNVINQGSSVVFNNLVPGIYTIRVYNAAITQDITTPVMLDNAPPITISPVLTNPKCSDTKDGLISLNLSGGVPPYAIEWNTFEFNNNIIANLTTGSYYVTVTDIRGCQSRDTFSLKTPSISVLPPTIANPACSGEASGSITITAAGGTPFPPDRYNYSWSTNTNHNNVHSSTLNNLTDGVYELTITDANACSAVLVYTLNPGSVLDVDSTLTNTTCYNLADGAINISATTNGTPAGPYLFTWSANAGAPVNTSTTSTVSNLPQGDYQVTISDGGSCQIIRNFTVGGFKEIKLQFFGKQEDNCSGNPSGAITLYPNGEAVPFIGVPNNYYKFTWSDGSTNHNVDAPNLQLVNLSGAGGAGKEYFVTITDANGCSADTSFFIGKKDAPLITFDTLQIIACQGGSNGILQAAIKASAGNPITNVIWSANAGTPTQTGDPNTTLYSTVSNLTGGQYIITIETQNGCTVSDTIRFEGQGSLNATDSIAPASCAGLSDGSITLTVNGGLAPYSFQWSNGAPNNNIASNLTAGLYTVTISDASGCPPKVLSYTVPAKPSVISSIDIASIKASSCYDAVVGDGSATVNASGGSAGTYTFIWSSGETSTGTSSTAVQLNGGIQYVTISDGICTIVDSVNIPSTPAIVINQNNSVFKDETCAGKSDGEITLSISGGNGGYNYAWSPSAPNLPSITNLSQGTYYLTITDAKNCILRDSFIVKAPLPFSVSLDAANTHNVNCAGASDGVIALSTQGGNPGIVNYTWSPAVTGNNPSASNLGPGNYFISVTDSKGCTDTISTQITEPTPISVSFGPIAEPQCSGYTTQFEINGVNGGSGPGYTYSIDNGNKLNVFTPLSISGGTHTLTVYDENGCTYTETFNVNEPAPILVSLPDKIELNLGDSVLVSPTISAVFPINQISWSPGTDISCTICDATYVSYIDNGYLVVTATDVNGCKGIDSTFVDVDKSRKVFFPNVFSPNRDGINEIFQPFTGPGVSKIDYFRVFDRWGALMYEESNFAPNSNGAGQGWDGWYRGKQMPPGVYTYVAKVEFEDNVSQLYFGSITLLR